MESISEVLVVLIIFGAIFGRGIIRIITEHREKVKKLELEHGKKSWQQDRAEMQQQIDALQQRVVVLEKIVTDKKYQLEQEIAAL